MFLDSITRLGREVVNHLQASVTEVRNRPEVREFHETVSRLPERALTQPPADAAGVALRRLAEIVGATRGDEAGLVAPTARAPRLFPLDDQGAVLANRYAPVFYQHPEEQFSLSDPTAFVQESALKRHRFGPDDELFGEGEVNPLTLDGISDPEDRVYLDHPNDDDARGGDPASAPVMYQYDARTRSVTYWAFYAYNKKDYVGPLTQEHEGDWERVTVQLDAVQRPVEVRYSSHEGSTTLPWNEAPKEGGRPVAYVARGSHANSPFAENQRVSVDGPDVYFPGPGGRAVPVDIAPDTDDEFARGGLRIDALPRLADVTTQGWYGTGVDWGSRGMKSYTSGPDGPSPEKGALTD